MSLRGGLRAAIDMLLPQHVRWDYLAAVVGPLACVLDGVLPRHAQRAAVEMLQGRLLEAHDEESLANLVVRRLQMSSMRSSNGVSLQ